MTKLLILSDLHNDIQPMCAEVDGRRIDADADVVVLAGDIHEGVQAPIWARQAFPDKEIILVAGNHEFYGRSWNKNLHELRQKSAELGIHFLEDDAVELFGIRFLGCTMWTDFALYGADQAQDFMAKAHERMSDYKRIKLDRLPGENQEWKEQRRPQMIPLLAQRRHEASVQWLDRELTAGNPDKTVVVTHHAPHEKSVPAEYKGHPLSPAYASDLSHLLGRSKLWIHGHIHFNADYLVGATRVICNPRGYSYAKREDINKEFRPDLIVEA
ncbi:hypothetical protein DW355_07030 [Hylemonella gracilis]|uniref:Calcineurin-like phosphoesterase domain-containing protein n=1 Tax=Hylemonella gracilis TaxID=80880 RepID=A0A4P6UHP3_9BURK|nr:metallophosphoesterase [Hylemonella gracilis]QBK04572.1 hypothetical protein DW355_07030 [Hylemonella gracilis]